MLQDKETKHWSGSTWVKRGEERMEKVNADLEATPAPINVAAVAPKRQRWKLRSLLAGHPEATEFDTLNPIWHKCKLFTDL